MKTIFIVLDTFRKDNLYTYNKDTTVYTPNLNAFCKNCNIFDNHYTGSLPCMPARRDIMTGRLDFLEREWGGLEPYDTVLSKELSLNNIHTHLVTDHYHYWELGGEGFITSFDTYRLFRGQVGDKIACNETLDVGEYLGNYIEQYEKNALRFEEKEDYPTIKTFLSAIDFLDEFKDNESFFLQVEGFDPHQPFDAPKEFYDIYNIDDKIQNKHYNTPLDGVVEDELTEIEYIKKRYYANVSLADYGFGLLIKKLKELNIYEECNIIFTSDHGYSFAEQGYYGKGSSHPYNEVSQIPLLHKLPFQMKSERYKCFTQNIDLAPTIYEMYNIKMSNMHGISYYPLVQKRNYKKRQNIITGFHGKSIMYVDKDYVLYKGPKSDDNYPLYEYKCTPTCFHYFHGSKYSYNHIDFSTIEIGRFLKHTNYPQFKFPKALKCEKYYGIENFIDDELYRFDDIEQKTCIENEELKLKLEKKLIDKLKYYACPEEQYIRLGLQEENIL